MGRVYEALKRAAEQNGAAGKGGNGEETHARAGAVDTNGDGRNGGSQPPGREGAAPEYLFSASKHFQTPETAHASASTEHTRVPGGSALPAGQASRTAGATLGAAGSTRTPEFVTLDISAARVEPHLVAITQPRSSHAERFRSLRTRVLHAGERRRMKAFVITSAGVMEGKTLTAVNLAWLLAQTDGVRALLIDGDLRQPCVADYLGFEAHAGLSEVLAGEAGLRESILRLEPAGLHFLPGGTARDDVAELLSGPRFLSVLNEARSLFDYVIVDAPPLGIFTDAAVLVDRADGAIVVARSGKTRYAALERLLEPLPRERILGVVLNGVNEEVDEKSYYYQRRYYPRRDVAPATAED